MTNENKSKMRRIQIQIIGTKKKNNQADTTEYEKHRKSQNEAIATRDFHDALALVNWFHNKSWKWFCRCVQNDSECCLAERCWKEKGEKVVWLFKGI